MPGGLLQLVAIGIDSIFLTSNPSITLFKIVYRRHTNFTLVTRTKPLTQIKKFNSDNNYILEKEADCIHKIWLNINISDLKIEYPKSTYNNILELCIKYGIFYSANKSPTDIVTYNEYINDIIPLFINQIELEVLRNNNLLIYIVL